MVFNLTSRSSFEKTFAILFAFTLLVTSAAQSQNTTQNNSKTTKSAQKQLNSTTKKLNTTTRKQDDISSNLSALQVEREKLNKLLIVTADRVKNSEVTLSKIEQKLVKLNVEKQQIRKKMAKRHGHMAAMLAIMQRMGRQPPPIMTTHRDDALKMVRSAMLLSSVFPQLKSKADKLANDLTQLVKVVAHTQEQAAQLRSETEKLTKKRQELAKLISSKKSRILSQQKELRIIRKAAERYANRAGSLRELVKKLDNEVSKKSTLGNYEKELAQGKIGLKSKINPSTGKKIELVPKGENVKVTSLINPARIKPALSFTNTKGLLPLPASGKRIKSFGTPNKYGGKAKGITFETRPKAQITSPSDGWIVYSGPFRSYGQLLIINAGGGYHILVAGMEKIDAIVGQFVLAGEPVATMGAKKVKSGQVSNTYGNRLYVEFRKDGKPIDPDPWWNTGNRKAQG
ncbi:MAG: peptidoglycan DD-metalloendopeptidase family protein [Pseudomonadota bacterium]